MMRSRVLTMIAAYVSLACARDASITHGADGGPECDRRLAAAIPIGMRADSARSTMERNGFRCSASLAEPSSLSCDKLSGERRAIVRRRWLATFSTQDGHIRAIK